MVYAIVSPTLLPCTNHHFGWDMVRSWATSQITTFQESDEPPPTRQWLLPKHRLGQFWASVFGSVEPYQIIQRCAKCKHDHCWWHHHLVGWLLNIYIYVCICIQIQHVEHFGSWHVKSAKVGQQVDNRSTVPLPYLKYWVSHPSFQLDLELWHNSQTYGSVSIGIDPYPF